MRAVCRFHQLSFRVSRVNATYLLKLGCPGRWISGAAFVACGPVGALITRTWSILSTSKCMLYIRYIAYSQSIVHYSGDRYWEKRRRCRRLSNSMRCCFPGTCRPFARLPYWVVKMGGGRSFLLPPGILGLNSLTSRLPPQSWSCVIRFLSTGQNSS